MGPKTTRPALHPVLARTLGQWQAHAEREHAPQAVGEWFQRSLVILTLLCLPISAAWLSARPLLLAFGQTPEVAAMTSSYIRWGAPALRSRWST